MKGIVFTEFCDLVEEQSGLFVLDRMLESSSLASGGAFTSVGTYDHAELFTLVTFYAAETGTDPTTLLREFGRRLFHRLAATYPLFLEGTSDPLRFLTQVHGTIHAEVAKLYPESELPRFTSRYLDDSCLEFVYDSPRGLADLAQGLIAGCSEHFDAGLTVERQPEGRPTYAVFHVRRAG